MNRETFLRHMTRLCKVGWTSKLNRNKEIRLRSPIGGRYTFCPVTALWFDTSGQVLPVRTPGPGRIGLKLTKALGGRIYDAADGTQIPWNCSKAIYNLGEPSFKYPVLRRSLIRRLNPKGAPA